MAEGNLKRSQGCLKDPSFDDLLNSHTLLRSFGVSRLEAMKFGPITRIWQGEKHSKRQKTNASITSPSMFPIHFSDCFVYYSMQFKL